MDKFCSKTVFYIICHKHPSFDKHASLLRNPHITNLQCFIEQVTEKDEGISGKRQLLDCLEYISFTFWLSTNLIKLFQSVIYELS